MLKEPAAAAAHPPSADESVLLHRPDDAIEHDVREAVERLLGEQERTVSFVVDHAEVVLVGNVARHDQLEHLMSCVEQVRGVTAVRNLVTVSAEANRRSQGLAERLTSALASTYPDCELEATCFGPVAVVSGRVPRLSTKHEVEQLVAHRDGIERVVNKIEVDGL